MLAFHELEFGKCLWIGLGKASLHKRGSASTFAQNFSEISENIRLLAPQRKANQRSLVEPETAAPCDGSVNIEL